MRKKSFMLLGNGTILNRGCEAILRSTAMLLREEFGPCQFINAPAISIHPQWYIEKDPDIKHVLPIGKRFSFVWMQYQINHRILHRADTDRYKRYLPKVTAVLAVGGDNYSLDYGSPKQFFKFNDSVLSHNKPLILWGASVGPFDKEPEFEKFAAEELKKVTLICARESETIDYLASLGVADNVRAVSDPAFSLIPEPVEDKSLNQVLKKPTIGINLSPLIERYWVGEKSWLESAEEAVRKVLDVFDTHVLLIPHVIYSGNNDYEFLFQVIQRLEKYKERIELVGPDYNAQQLKWIISRLSLFIGARTHATIAALSSCVPTISIGYSIKARGINKDIFGHLDWLLPLNQFEGDMFIDKIGRLLDTGLEVRNYLSNMMPNYIQKSKQAAHYLKEIISINA